MAWRELTREELQETKRHFAGHPDDYVAIAMAMEVILTMLGPDWWKRNIVANTGSADEFLRRSETSEESGYNHQHRVTLLGHMLWLLKECQGFDNLIASLKTEEVESVFFELFCAKSLFENEFEVEFVKERGEKGEDYDLRGYRDSATFFVEAKTRRAGSLMSGEKLESTLKTARSQLPATGPGIVFVSIPVSWTFEPNAELTISGAINSFLGGTQRVNHVVVIWHHWHQLKQGRANVTRVREYVNGRARTQSPLSRVVKLLNPPHDRVIPEQRIFVPSFW